jgi:hypothetical protein
LSPHATGCAHRNPEGGLDLFPLAPLLLDGRFHAVRLRLRRGALRLELRLHLLLQRLCGKNQVSDKSRTLPQIQGHMMKERTLGLVQRKTGSGL